MADTIDPRLVRERERIKKAKERLAKAAQREKQIAAELEVSKRRAEITQSVQGAVKQALSTLKLDLPPDGLTLFIHREGDNGSFGVDVKLGNGKSSNGNGSRKSITLLGYTGFVLPDGSEVKTPAGVLDHFKHPHFVKGKSNNGDAAQREILKWAKDNPGEAETVKVVIGKERVSLSEALKRI